MKIDLARDMEMYLQVIVYHKYKADKHIHIDMFIMIAKINDVSYSLEIANPRDPLTRNPLIHDPLNTDVSKTIPKGN